MAPMLEVTDEVYARVRQLARFASCDDSDVIQRLLGQLDQGDFTPSQTKQVARISEMTSESRYLPGRAPRERGARVRIGNETFHVDSVRDLFETALRYLTKNGKRESIKALIPFKTSSQRYLIAEKPVHPNGNPFFVPVQLNGLYMEAHKSYRTAIGHLEEFLNRAGVPFEYISG